MRRKSLIFIISLFLVFMFSSCDIVCTSYPVFFKETNDSMICMKTTVKGKVTPPETPVKDGYEFVGWYSSVLLNSKFDFDKYITAQTNVYAGWEKVSE